jgi:hypothetical protein
LTAGLTKLAQYHRGGFIPVQQVPSHISRHRLGAERAPAAPCRRERAAFAGLLSAAARQGAPDGTDARAHVGLASAPAPADQACWKRGSLRAPVPSRCTKSDSCPRVEPLPLSASLERAASARPSDRRLPAWFARVQLSEIAPARVAVARRVSGAARWW